MDIISQLIFSDLDLFHQSSLEIWSQLEENDDLERKIFPLGVHWRLLYVVFFNWLSRIHSFIRTTQLPDPVNLFNMHLQNKFWTVRISCIHIGNFLDWILFHLHCYSFYQTRSIRQYRRKDRWFSSRFLFQKSTHTIVSFKYHWINISNNHAFIFYPTTDALQRNKWEQNTRTALFSLPFR